MTKPPSSPRLSLILTLLVAAQFVIVLDFSIVQIALPTMRTELAISLANSQWIVSAYGLTFAGFLLLSGRASDLYGRRRLFGIGLVVFALSSLAGGLAPSEAVLIGARAVQGIGAAIASATGLSLLVVTFPEGRERNRALSVFAAVSSAAFAAGVILGGVLTATLGWRSIFFVNVPIGIVTAVTANRFLVESRGDISQRRLDLPGALSVTAGLSILVYALTNAANEGLLSLQTLAPLALSAVVLAGFVVIEHKSSAPLMPLSFLRRGAVFSANALAILTISAVSAMIFLLTIYLQQIQGYSALSAGFAFLPTALVFLSVGGYLSAKLVTRFGARPVLLVGMTIQAAGFLLLNQLSVETPYLTALLPAMLVVSLGAATSFTAFNIAALSGARKGEEGLASGLINTTQQIGGAIGLAAATTIATTYTTSYVDAHPGATGVPVPGYAARVVDDSGRPLPAGVVGRLAVKGPTGCRYLADPRQTQYVKDGWNYTGDAYLIDEAGYFVFQARTDDMIVSAGYNIAGPEVESALLLHAAVAECGVVGATDEQRGQIVKAYVVLKAGYTADETTTRALQDFVKQTIAPYKYPRAIEYVPSLPRTETGKLQRFKLRQSAQAKVAAS